MKLPFTKHHSSDDGGDDGGHSKKKKKRGGAAGAARMFISLIVIGILLFGFYLAYRNFSGVDPLALDPKSVAKNFITSESVVDLITGFLSVSPEQSLDKAKRIINGDPNDPDSLAAQPDSPLLFKVAVIADSHTDIANLEQALARANSEGVAFIVGIGDLSNVGTIQELRSSKIAYDAIGVPYYAIPGDHDLWDSRDKTNRALTNFEEVFGNPYQSFTYQNTRFLLIDNSDNYLGLDSTQMSWVEEELNRVKLSSDVQLVIAFADIPLFHPSSDHVMGKVNTRLKDQAEHLLSRFEGGGVDAVFSADTHYSSKYKEPTTNIQMYTTGAVTSDKNPQVPRFMVIDIYEDGSYNVREIEIN